MSEKNYWRPSLPHSLKLAISSILENNEFLRNKYDGKESEFVKDAIWDKIKEARTANFPEKVGVES